MIINNRNIIIIIIVIVIILEIGVIIEEMIPFKSIQLLFMIIITTIVIIQ
jgi:hypothetical protein